MGSDGSVESSSAPVDEPEAQTSTTIAPTTTTTEPPGNVELSTQLETERGYEYSIDVEMGELTVDTRLGDPGFEVLHVEGSGSATITSLTDDRPAPPLGRVKLTLAWPRELCPDIVGYAGEEDYQLTTIEGTAYCAGVYADSRRGIDESGGSDESAASGGGDERVLGVEAEWTFDEAKIPEIETMLMSPPSLVVLYVGSEEDTPLSPCQGSDGVIQVIGVYVRGAQGDFTEVDPASYVSEQGGFGAQFACDVPNDLTSILSFYNDGA